MKIVVLDGHALNPGDLSWNPLEGFGDLTVYDRTPQEKIVERIGEAEIIFTNKTSLTKEIFAQVPQVKYIGVLATGYNVVDLDAAQKNDIVVTNVPAYGTNAVAQHVFALLLELCNHVGEHSQAVQEGVWANSPDFCFWNHPVVELAGKTIGIIGYGRIGQRTGELAQAFGMDVLVYDKQQNQELESDTIEYVELADLLQNSDVISLHCPLSESTKGLINKDAIAQMKEGVMIVNTARGGLIVEEDLAAALNNGQVAGAAVDVLSVEPAQMDNPLLKAKNTIITPHIAWASQESRQRLMNIAVDNLEQFLAGDPVNVVVAP
ncbi:D-2-hydroxyacid dehydrogenase [Halanaerobaculum tunisiense]